jgi:hypothetical protein
VLASEKQSNQQTHNLVIGKNGTILLVGEVDEQLQDIGALTVVGTIRSAGSNDLGEDGHHFLSSLGTLGVSCDRSIGEEEGKRGDTLVQVVVDAGDISEHVLSDIIAVQAARGSQDGELGESIQDVDGTRVAPGLQVLQRLHLNLSHIALQSVGTQTGGHGLVLLGPSLGLGIVHNAFAEHGRHEGIHLRLGHVLIRQLEKGSRCLRTQQEGEVLAHHGDGVHRTELVQALADKGHGIAGELQVVAQEGNAHRGIGWGIGGALLLGEDDCQDDNECDNSNDHEHL